MVQLALDDTQPLRGECHSGDIRGSPLLTV
jgi:hypothetical protein